MSCHNNASNEASKESFWNLAGTVYNNDELATNVMVELWSEPNGKGFKISSLVFDKRGNIYTCKIINFNDGCDPFIKNGTKPKAMLWKFKGGKSCSNSNCHGGLIDQINIK